MLELEFLEHDVNVLAYNWVDILALIGRNPFSERIKFLLEHQELSNRPVPNLAGELGVPECKGTAFWIAGVSKLDYPYQANDDELNQHMEQSGPKRWDDFFRVHNERRIPGAFCFSYSAQVDSWHAGIYLGEIGEEHVLFAQHGTGNKFGPESLRYYSHPDYYIPRSLK